MKKILEIIFILILLVTGYKDFKKINFKIDSNNKYEDTEKIDNLVSSNGWLRIENNMLVNEKGEPFRLKGMSTHGIQWYANFASYSMIKSLKDEWHSNLFRVAMYTVDGGYIKDRSIKETVKKIVDDAIKLDMYVIIDWHILHDNNPLTYKEEAKEFFDEMSNLYKDYPNVLYEICNEPNGDVTWENDIKPYAEEVISVIRKNSKNSIIIVGTGNYSQDIDKITNKIDDKNTMYALHFYAGTHKDELRNKAEMAIKNIPIFVTEWGTSDNSGSNGIYIEESLKWIEFMDKYNISWANWSLSDKNESSALLLPNSKIDRISDEYLSESGKFIKQVMLEN